MIRSMLMESHVLQLAIVSFLLTSTMSVLVVVLICLLMSHYAGWDILATVHACFGRGLTSPHRNRQAINNSS